MHKDASATRIEGLEQERAFEDKFGRPMTLEEKKFIGLSDEMFRHESMVEPFPDVAPRSFENADNGSLGIRLVSHESERQGKKVA